MSKTTTSKNTVSNANLIEVSRSDEGILYRTDSELYVGNNEGLFQVKDLGEDVLYWPGLGWFSATIEGEAYCFDLSYADYLDLLSAFSRV